MMALSEVSAVDVTAGNQLIRSRWLGEIEFGPNSELIFPAGLPGFEAERTMLPVEIPAQKPLVYLQSLTNPEVCFVALPVFIVNSGFHLRLSDEERSILQLSGDGEPGIGVDVLCLALLMPSLGTVRVNLNAPVVINLHNSRSVQCVSTDGDGGFYRLAENGQWEITC